MNNATFNRLTFDSFPASGGKQQTYTADGRLVSVRTKTYATDSVLRATQTRTYTADALLQGGSSKFYTADAVLATPYHDNAHWSEAVGNNLSLPIDPNRLAVWSTYSRPSSPIPNQAGINAQTGKIEYWNGSSWRNYDGTAA